MEKIFGNHYSVKLEDYTSPAVTENKRGGWVEYGDDNNYFQHLVDQYNSSPTNNACIRGIADLIYGDGLKPRKADRNIDAYLKVKKLFSEDCIRMTSFDLKLYGQFAWQIVYAKNGKEIAQVNHWPIQTLRPECANEDGKIENYYYCSDWTKSNDPEYTPEPLPAYGSGNNKIEYYVCGLYTPNMFYFYNPDYLGALQYAELEAEIANYHLNNIKQGFSATTLVNFNNGVPDEEKQDELESAVHNKLTGTNGKRVIVSFNDDAETATSVETFEISNASEQYQFLSDESRKKIMVGHRVTSPRILGINDGGGLGNNADEIVVAFQLFENIVIRPYQKVIIGAVDMILSTMGLGIDLMFKSLEPVEFKDNKASTENVEMKSITMSSDCGCKQELKDADDPCWDGYEMVGFKNVNGKKVPNCVPINAGEQEMSEDDANEWLSHLSGIGETIDGNEWELMESEPVDEKDEQRYEFFSQYAEPDDKSGQDKGLFKIRYSYAPQAVSENSRDFCGQMVSAAKQGIVYRREDIIKMGKQGVNGEFAPSGKSNYSIWLYKGGSNCHHYWMRNVYFRKREDGKFLPNAGLENDKKISVNEAKRKGLKPDVNPKDVATRPIDMPNQGRLK